MVSVLVKIEDIAEALYADLKPKLDEKLITVGFSETANRLYVCVKSASPLIPRRFRRTSVEVLIDGARKRRR